MRPTWNWLGVLLLATAALVPSALPPPLAAARSGSVRREVADLQDQLEKGLKARRPEEFRFIRTVVTLVEDEVLPLELVKGTFQWARKKHERYPFPYFERGLRLRALRELGVVIP